MFLVVLISGSTAAQQATIHGYVRFRESREPAISVNILLEGKNRGTVTNTKGYYVLPGLPPGNYSIRFLYMGYETVTRTVTLAAGLDAELNVALVQTSVQGKKVTVIGERGERKNDIVTGRITVTPTEFRRMPQVAEPDLFRSLQMLPGVATLSDFSAGLYVRGGSPDQNLILLDHIDVYNPNHMFGFFSTFNTDAVKSVKLLKGGFPARYGGRLSSVLDVVNKEGNRNETHGTARVSLLSSSLTLEGPWKKGSWMGSFRRTYLDLAASLMDIDLPYYFYDGHFKINYDADSRNQISLSGYLGNDVLDLETAGSSISLDWGNRTFSSQWTHLFSSTLFAHFVLAGSEFNSNTLVRFEDAGFGITNRIDDISLKGMLSYTQSPDHSIDFGFESKMLNFGLDYRIVDLTYKNRYDGFSHSVYVQDNYRFAGINVLQTGLRLNYYSEGGYLLLAPRAAYKRVLGEHLDATLTWGRYSQFLNLIQQEGFSFADMWLPVDATFPPGEADHYIAGISFDNGRSISVDAEVYLKKYRNIAEYRAERGADEQFAEMTAAMNFMRGDATSYGADIYIRNNLWRMKGWIGYSLNWIRKQVDGYNFDKPYYPTYDRRHTVTVMQDVNISGKLRLNIAFKYGSGQPYTESTARYAVMNPYGEIYYTDLEGEKNTRRLPAYHRLDLGLFYESNIFSLDAEWYLQVVNAYKHRNVWFRRYDNSTNPSSREDFTMLPLLPTFGVTITF